MGGDDGDSTDKARGLLPPPVDDVTEKFTAAEPPSMMGMDGEMPAPGAIALPGTPVPALETQKTKKLPYTPDTEEHGVGARSDTYEQGASSDTQDAPGPAGLATPAVLHADDVLGSYRIVRRLGGGGIGEVYEAEHIYIGRRVAVKVLREDARERQDTVQRFFDEARVVNRVRHPNIIDVTDLVYQPGLPPFIVMELLHGHDLADEIADHAPLAPARVVGIARQIASALAALHAAGIAHRDLKPANVVLLDRDGSPDTSDTPEVRLIDFGVAKVLERDPTINHPETMHGSILGTLDYMSPEQGLGEPADPRADVFALGIVMHEMATSQRPYSAATLPELLLEFTKKVTAADVKPRALRALVLACLTTDRDDRPDMADVAETLAKL